MDVIIYPNLDPGYIISVVKRVPRQQCLIWVYLICQSVKVNYCKISNIRGTKSLNLNVSRLGLQLSFCAIYWSPVLGGEWDVVGAALTGDAPTTYIWVINNLIAYESASYIRELTVVILHLLSLQNITQSCGLWCSRSISLWEILLWNISFKCLQCLNLSPTELDCRLGEMKFLSLAEMDQHYCDIIMGVTSS